MEIKESTINSLFSNVCMVLSLVSGLMGREFAVGATCLIVGVLYRILSSIEELKERGR